jgi:hypothetical protein
MMNNYLFGIPWEHFEGISGIYVTRHHIRGWRYFSTYKNGEAKKFLVFKKLAEAGANEIKGDWDWHHVVEGNHLAPLFSLTDYNNKYNYEWPTVLMHSAEEHKILNSLFRSKGTLEGLENKGTAPLPGDERRKYIHTLDQRYQDIYTGDPVLQKMAHNVIRSIK